MSGARLSGYGLGTVLALLGVAPAAGQAVVLPGPPATEPLALTSPSGVLHGTLLVPAGAAWVPVVLIHPGSGPTDRDGNSPLLPGKNNSLRLLAEGLAARGVASLRIDKRGIAASAAATTAEADLRLEVAGMNHVLKLVGGTLPDQMASYGDSTLPVAPGLLDGVAAFVHDRRVRKAGDR